MITINVLSSVSLFSIVEYILFNLISDIDATIFIERVTRDLQLDYDNSDLAQCYFESITDFNNPDYEDNIF